MKTLVVGWGNPIAGDDAVGLKAADAVAEHLANHERGDIDVIATSFGGFRLAERTLGYDRVLVLDARIEEGSGPDLTITRVAPDDLKASASVHHDGTLADALRALRTLDESELPEEVILMSVPIAPPTDWSEEMSTDAKAASERLAQAALLELEGIPLG